MKTLKANIIIILLLLSGAVMAQDTSTETEKEKEAITRVLTNLRQQKVTIVEKEKERLKVKVEAINEQLANGEITETEAERLKKEAAELHARNIDNKIGMLDNQIALVERNGLNVIDDENYIKLGLGVPNDNGDRLLGIEIKRKENRERVYKDGLRTKGALVFSFGLNNTIIDGQSLDDSPYKIGGSRYAELGYVWSTRVFENTNWLRFKYGFSFQFNGLKPEGNRYFVDNGATTSLEEFPQSLDKSKFRTDNLVIPIHFEIGPSNRKEKDGVVGYNTHDKFKIGIGGYAGLNISTRQKLKFDNEDGERVKQKLKANYNTNNFVYGLSGYVGYSDISLYVKYDLNPLFKTGVEQRNVSLGVRWDWD